MKKLKLWIFMILILPCCWIFTGCTFGEAYVVGIEKTGTNGNSEVYTIYYSNGKSTNFTVENGKDGEDLDIEDIFSACVARGLYANDNTGFKAFLSDYLVMENESGATTESVNKAAMSAVSIYSHFTTKASYFGASTSELGCGAGVIYKMDQDYSYIITNYHVVYNKNSVTSNGIANEIVAYQYGADIDIKEVKDVWQLSGNKVNCEYIGGSMMYDIAVLKVNTADLKAVNSYAMAVEVADGYSLGESVMAVGNPEGWGISVTRGTVSVLSEEIDMKGVDGVTDCVFRVMRIDTAINGGNSGGGLFNAHGELVGIVNAKSMKTDSGDVLEGMAYALPHDNVTKVADNIMYNYADGNSATFGVNKFSFGITYEVVNGRAEYNPLDGSIVLKNDLKITALTSTLASKHFEIGDVITGLAINGTSYVINQAHQFKDLTLTIREGDDLLITVIRDGKSKPVEIKDVSLANFQIVA